MATSTTNSLANAIAHAKCPQCREGDMFKHDLRHITKFVSFNETCPVCDLRFDREPGFFHGAMYISYAMIVAMVTIVCGFLYFALSDPELEVYVYTIVVLNIVLLPIFFRYSRVIYLYVFGGVKFNNELHKKS